MIQRLAARWRAASPVTRYLLPLVLLCLVVGLDWLRLHVNGIATREEARHLFTRIGVVAALAAIVMVAGARRWRVQGIGLLTFLVGCAGLFARVLGQWGPQPTDEWERDLYQATLDVGGVLLFVGLVLWLLARWIRHVGSDAPTEELMGTAPK